MRLCGDDTVDEHRGKKVYGKGCHRDAVRSPHSFTAYRWGHKWVVLAILWAGKTERTFSDAITAVRRRLWTDWVFATPKHYGAFAKLSRPISAVLLYALAPAA